MKTLISLAAMTACLGLGNAHAAANFVNGLAIPGGALDLSGGTSANNGRIGFFSDLYFDPNRNEWWGVSDRGPGGGTISYDTRVQRFTLDVDMNTGSISNFQIQQTILFRDGGQTMNGLAPSPSNTLGRALDPEGLVILPKSGNLLVSDEYGPSVKEFDRSGNLVRSYNIPANLIPKVGADINYNAAAASLTSGREGNRGFEGLAVSPDGKFAYAMLQNGTVQDGWSAASRGLYTRIVKFDTTTGEAVGQYAYKLESAGQGRGISAIVALGDDKFLVLERNNRGIGAGANVASPDKNVFRIDLAAATDVSSINLPATGNLPAGYVAATKNATKVADLDANTLAALGNKSPEKWEGLAIGPKLNNGSFLMLAGTDNDYSVTQNGSNVQFDVYFDFSLADPYAGSIQCPLGSTSGCFLTADNTTSATLSGAYALVPGVLHAYTVGMQDIGAYTAPVPEPQTYALMLLGLAAVGAAARRRR